MTCRLLFLAIVLAAMPLRSDDQSTTSPRTIRPTATHGSQQNALLLELQHALRRDAVEPAIEYIAELLRMGTAPVTIFHQVRAAATPRGEALLPTVLRDKESEELEPLRRELLLLLAVHSGEDATAESLMAVSGAASPMSHQTLSAVASTARASGNVSAALWAYQELRKHHEASRRQIVVPLAECLVRTNRIKEAAAVLDSFLGTTGAPVSYQDAARLLRARLLYKQEEETKKAISLLGEVKDRRARTEAELLTILFEFLESGNDSLTSRLERLARMRPDIKEANDAFELARLSPLLPTGTREREAVLHALRLDARERWESAATAYLSISHRLSEALSSSLEIRAARCLERVGEFEKALAIWAKAATREGKRPIALLGKGDCQAAMGRADSAAATYLLLLKQYPESPHAARARSRLLD